MRREISFRLWLMSALMFPLGATPAESSFTASTREELFQLVFKRPSPPIPVESYVIVVVDGTVRQKMRAVLAPNGEHIFLEGKALIALLSPVLQAELIQQLELRIDRRGFLDRAVLEDVGLTVAFNPRAFECSLTIPPSMRASRTLYISPPPLDAFGSEALRPASVS